MSDEIKKVKQKFPVQVIVGIITIVLAVVGLITVFSFCVNFGKALLDNSKEKEKFERCIYPIVMFDPATIESVDEFDDLILLRSSIWSAFVNNMEKYPMDQNNRISVPKSDVDVACAKLFGSEIVLNHQSFSDYMSTYYYDESKEKYLVPMDGSAVLYTPQVEYIQQDGTTFTLKVGYLANGNQWLETLQGKDYVPTPEKYMIYTMREVGSNYQLVSIQYPEEGAVPGKPVAQPQSSDGVLPQETPSDEQNPQQENSESKETI